MSYDDEDFLQALEKALTAKGISLELTDAQRAVRARNHERLVRLGLKKQ